MATENRFRKTGNEAIPTDDRGELLPPYFRDGSKICRVNPAGNRVLIMRDFERESEGGIVMPDTHKETSMTGVIIGVGPLVTTVEVGQRVMFSRYTGREIQRDLILSSYKAFENVMIAVEDDIIGYVDEHETVSVEEVANAG